MKFKFSIRLLLMIVAFTLLVGRVYLQSGIPYTHDGQNHLARFANYKIALKEGQMPPRWAPNLMNHYGYPVFNYNYPLANLLSAPFSALKIPYEVTFKLIALLFLIGGGFGIINLARVFNQSKSKHNWLVLGIYYTSYYLVNLIYFRGNIGEILAYALFPWLLFSLIKPPKFNLKTITLWTAWLLVHNLMTVFGGLIALTIAIVFHKFDIQILKKFLPIGLVSLALSMWFWLPAVAELSLVDAGHSNIVTEAEGHLLQLPQLFFGQPQFGFSRLGSIDGLSFALGPIQIAVLLIGLIWIFSNIKNNGFKKGMKKRWWLFILLIPLIFWQTTSSQWWWQPPSPLMIMQFPWRLSFFVAPILAILAPSIWNQLKSKTTKTLLIVLLIYQTWFIFQLQPIDKIHHDNQFYDDFGESTTTAYEDRPIGFKYLLIADWQRAPFIVEGEGESVTEFWSGSKHLYQLNLSTDALLIEPTMLFAGWETRANNQLVKYIDSDDIQGRLAYQLPAGKYKVETRFTQNTLARKLGNGITILGLLSILTYFGYNWFYNPKKT